jgi:hypothetical protein
MWPMFYYHFTYKNCPNESLCSFPFEVGCFTPCHLVEIDRRFRGAYCLHHQSDDSFHADDGGKTFVDFTGLHGATSQNIVVFRLVALWTWSLLYSCFIFSAFLEEIVANPRQRFENCTWLPSRIPALRSVKNGVRFIKKPAHRCSTPGRSGRSPLLLCYYFYLWFTGSGYRTNWTHNFTQAAVQPYLTLCEHCPGGHITVCSKL